MQFAYETFFEQNCFSSFSYLIFVMTNQLRIGCLNWWRSIVDGELVAMWTIIWRFAFCLHPKSDNLILLSYHPLMCALTPFPLQSSASPSVNHHHIRPTYSQGIHSCLNFVKIDLWPHNATGLSNNTVWIEQCYDRTRAWTFYCGWRSHNFLLQ